MKIWLINPPETVQNQRSMRSVVQNLYYNSPPLGLAYLAAYMEQKGHQLTITDCPVENVSPDDLVAQAKKIEPDLIGFTSTTTHFFSAIAAAKVLRNEQRDVPICIGGPHFNANPELLLEHDFFDFGVRGEGELTFDEAVRNLEQGKKIFDVPGVISAQSGELKYASPRERIKDLDSLPFPARHLLPLDKYRAMPNDQYRLPKASAVTSRGCPFHCSFCDKSTFGDFYKKMSAERIVEEMHLLHDQYGIRDIAFVDSLFAPAQKWLVAFLDAFEKNRPDVSWTCSGRANVYDEALLKRMKAAGCWRIRIAIESGNQEILDRIDKGISKEEFKRTVRLADAAGLQVKVFFMIGHLGETPETIAESVELAKSVPIKDITVQINTPLKGTRQYEEVSKYGKLMTEDLSRYNFFQPVFVPNGFTSQQLFRELQKFYRSFYLSPAVVWRHIKAIRKFSDVIKYFRAAPLVVNLLFRKRQGG